MHTKPQINSDSTGYGQDTFLQRYSGAFLGLFLVMVLVTICAYAYTAGLLNIRPADLVLKPQGCALLQHYGIRTEPLDTSDTCRATVMFRSTIFSDAVYLDDERIELAHEQIVAIAPPSKGMPWSAMQIRWVAITTVMIALTIAMAVLNQIGSRRPK